MERRRATRAYALVHVGAAAQQEAHESDTARLVFAERREEEQTPTVFVYVVYVARALGLQLRQMLRRFAVEVAPHARYIAIARVKADKSR